MAKFHTVGVSDCNVSLSAQVELYVIQSLFAFFNIKFVILHSCNKNRHSGQLVYQIHSYNINWGVVNSIIYKHN